MSEAKGSVKIEVYRWAGSWGPFKVKIPCGECALTGDVLEDVAKKELAGVPLEIETRDWLSHWWKPLLKNFAWHAPIVSVGGKVVSEGEALNRGVLTQEVVGRWVSGSALTGNHLFGKAKCGHCTRAKEMLTSAGVEYEYHDVVESPRALYEMLARVKPLVGKKTPITTPQIWLGGEYVGGAEELGVKLGGGKKAAPKADAVVEEAAPKAEAKAPVKKAATKKKAPAKKASPKAKAEAAEKAAPKTEAAPKAEAVVEEAAPTS